MKFGSVRTSDAQGAILAHTLIAGTLRLKKGHVLNRSDLDALNVAGIEHVTVAQLDVSDVDENRAAARLASAFDLTDIQIGPASTGRVNLSAGVNGLFRVDREAVDRFNLVSPTMTIATLNDYTAVAAGELVATIKIIPFAVPADRLAEAETVASAAGLLRLLPFESVSVGLAATELPSLKPSVMDKTAKLLQARLELSGSHIGREMRVSHDSESLAGAIRELRSDSQMIVIFGASAIVDPLDVIPEAIQLAGGTVDHVGMPVDPGNLLVIGRLGDIPVIGAPGCARSPKENGFDWVLARILAGETVGAETIMHMGVGGLLKEIASRPQPRKDIGMAAPTTKSVDILVLAAGQASRMRVSGTESEPDGAQSSHKLLAEFDGVPLIRKSVQTALRCDGGTVHVVVGFRADEMRQALSNLDVDIIENAEFESGMASSLKKGVQALSEQAAGMLILLADMPLVEPAHLDTMLNVFSESGGRCVVRAVCGDIRGNPVILPRVMFDSIAGLEGDVGARQVIASSGLPIIDVDIGDAALLDVDTREAVLSAGGVLKD